MEVCVFYIFVLLIFWLELEKITPNDVLTTSEKLSELSSSGALAVIKEFNKESMDWKYFMKLMINWMEQNSSTGNSKIQLLGILKRAAKGLPQADKDILTSIVDGLQMDG